MLGANENRYSRNLQIAVWKMLRAGVPTPVIFSTLRLAESELGGGSVSQWGGLKPPARSSR